MGVEDLFDKFCCFGHGLLVPQGMTGKPAAAVLAAFPCGSSSSFFMPSCWATEASRN